MKATAVWGIVLTLITRCLHLLFLEFKVTAGDKDKFLDTYILPRLNYEEKK
jgi:hypothetical protein